jgi:hypothetical protein
MNEHELKRRKAPIVIADSIVALLGLFLLLEYVVIPFGLVPRGPTRNFAIGVLIVAWLLFVGNLVFWAFKRLNAPLPSPPPVHFSAEWSSGLGPWFPRSGCRDLCTAAHVRSRGNHLQVRFSRRSSKSVSVVEALA